MSDDGRRRAEEEFLAELDEAEAASAPHGPRLGPPGENPPQRRPGSDEQREAALRRVNALGTTLGVLFVLVVLPATFALGGFGMLGLCYDGCSDAQEALFLGAFALVPVAYAVLSIRWLRRLRRDVEADPAGAKVMSPGSVVLGALAAVLLAVLALVVTCFGMLGLLGW